MLHWLETYGIEAIMFDVMLIDGDDVVTFKV